MKKKTINAVICKKMDQWMSSIEDPEIRSMVAENTIVTGGCISSMLLGEKVNDFDVYFTNRQTALAVANYYVNEFNNLPEITTPVNGVDDSKTDRVSIKIESAGVAKKGTPSDYEYFETVGGDSDQSQKVESYLQNDTNIEQADQQKDDLGAFHPIFVSENAIMLTGKVQLVFRFYGEPDDIHGFYDFVHCTNYWTSKDRKVVLRQDALESILAKELRYISSKYPICAIIRTRKFIGRGWTITAGEYLKMCFAVSKLDLSDTDVLRDQLTGVDVAYFDRVISAIENKKQSDPNFDISEGYLVSLIDKIF